MKRLNAKQLLVLPKGKDDIEKKSSDSLFKYVHSRDFGIRLHIKNTIVTFTI